MVGVARIRARCVAPIADVLERRRVARARRSRAVPAAEYGVRIRPLARDEAAAAHELERRMLETIDWPL